MRVAGVEAALAARVPAWRAVDPEAVSAFAVAITGIWTISSERAPTCPGSGPRRTYDVCLASWA